MSGQKHNPKQRPSGTQRGLGAVLVLSAALLPTARALAQGHTPGLLLQRQPLPALRAASSGYLGVDLADVDSDKAQALKLKEARGALITLIDHDAPAGQVGLRINDVILEINGEKVANAEEARKRLHEIAAGHKAVIVLSRDGEPLTLTAQLADRNAMEHDVWNKLSKDADAGESSALMGILPGAGDTPPSPGFHMPFFGGTLNVGALVEPLTKQMAEVLGVHGGLIVKQITHRSEADAAGLRAFDVIVKVGNETIQTSADWARALHANQGRAVSITVLRDHKPQVLTLQVDSHRRGMIDPIYPGAEPDLNSLRAELESGYMQQSGRDAHGLAFDGPVDPQLENASLTPESLAAQARKLDPLQLAGSVPVGEFSEESGLLANLLEKAQQISGTATKTATPSANPAPAPAILPQIPPAAALPMLLPPASGVSAAPSLLDSSALSQMQQQMRAMETDLSRSFDAARQSMQNQMRTMEEQMHSMETASGLR